MNWTGTRINTIWSEKTPSLCKIHLLSWSLIPIWLYFKLFSSYSLLFQTLTGWFHVFHAWFVILWDPVRAEHVNEVMSSSQWDWNCSEEGLLNKTGTRPLCAFCLGEWSSHCHSQGCVWVGSWGGGTVLRYWGRQHQNHTTVHPLWSLKPRCVHFWKVLQDGLRALLCGADTSTSQGQLLWPTRLQTGRTGPLGSPRPNLLMCQDSRCIMNWLRPFWACIAPELLIIFVIN